MRLTTRIIARNEKAPVRFDLNRGLRSTRIRVELTARFVIALLGPSRLLWLRESGETGESLGSAR
jgi:hypothetical protein